MTRTDVVASISLVILWSSGFIGAELGTAYTSANTLLGWRYVVAVVILGLWCWFRGLRPTWTSVRRQVVLGFFCQFLYLACIFAGVAAGVPAGTSALIAAMQPLVVAALSTRLLGERFGRERAVAMAVGFGGVILVVAGDLGGGSAAWPAYLLPVVGMLSLSVGTVLERRMQTNDPIPLAMFVQGAVAATLFMAWNVVTDDVAPPMTSGFWVAVGWLVVLSTFGAYGVYLFVVRRRGATTASSLLLLTPATTMVWAFLMFDAPITWLAVIGASVVCAREYIARCTFALTRREAPRPSRPIARR
ncbi:DMT family transporter [Rhodococcus sp. BP-252]|uniref:DMT family transporter n=1 Tax=Nocardiaceae TaxID=85025 RepID=UPI0009FD9EC0|nr:MULTISPECIES: DMT family transporter [Rhodococcus]MBY6414746.1 DMT family transporter [Rhodococcus sp. BP-320]MBY6419650.1 DMT family transporter [Rhodococcus sp. BP-321]MBY6424630.1 DMT family transporter [Rhodococcus sp. BP-324]MBY6429627.1 DMT family transporter [Rhodococcus sp. BP-323]MBY6434596.1 DMT family transporter [Rhodococcus sp. BP-322]